MNKTKKSILTGLIIFFAGNVTAKPVNKVIKNVGRKIFLKPSQAIVRYLNPTVNIKGEIIDKENGMYYIEIEDYDGFKGGYPHLDHDGRIINVYPIASIINNKKNEINLEIGKEYTLKVYSGGPPVWTKGPGEGPNSYNAVPGFYINDIQP